jgi:hypothetical protein
MVPYIKSRIKEHFGHSASLLPSSKHPIPHLGQYTTRTLDNTPHLSLNPVPSKNKPIPTFKFFFRKKPLQHKWWNWSIALGIRHTNWNTLPSLTCILHKVSTYFTQNKCWHESLTKFEPDCFRIKVREGTFSQVCFESTGSIAPKRYYAKQ